MRATDFLTHWWPILSAPPVVGFLAHPKVRAQVDRMLLGVIDRGHLVRENAILSAQLDESVRTADFWRTSHSESIEQLDDLDRRFTHIQEIAATARRQLVVMRNHYTRLLRDLSVDRESAILWGRGLACDLIELGHKPAAEPHFTTAYNLLEPDYPGDVR